MQILYWAERGGDLGGLGRVWGVQRGQVGLISVIPCQNRFLSWEAKRLEFFLPELSDKFLAAEWDFGGRPECLCFNLV